MNADEDEKNRLAKEAREKEEETKRLEDEARRLEEEAKKKSMDEE